MQEDKLLDFKNQEIGFLVEDIRDKNREKALSVVAPIDDALANLGAMGKLPKQAPGASLDSMIASATNKVKMVDYSNVKYEDVYSKYSDGTFTPRYDQYSTVNLDQEEVAASRQSSGDIWSNALPKFTGKLLTNTIGQLGGIFYGIGAAVNTGSMQSIYDNSFMDAVNDANTFMDNKLPTYKSKADREATGLDYLTRQTTWADDFLNGTAFFGGAILSEAAIEWATGGAASSTALARWGAKLEQLPGFAKTLNAARKMSNPAAKAFATGRLETKLATNLGKTGELLHTIRFTATSAGYESAFEANAYMKESEANYYNSFQEANGRMPTVEEEMDFRRNLKTSADGLFGFNMAIVGSSNLAIMGKWFDVKSPLTAPSKWANSKLFGVGYKKVGEDVVEITGNKLQKALGKSYGFAKPMFVEGIWEEGMQSVGTNTASNWVQAKYDPKYTKNTYDLVDSFSDGLAETYGTAEGWKEIQMGMLIGLIGGAAGNKYNTGKFNPEYSQAVAKNKLTVDTMNAYSGKRVAETMAYANRVQSANEASEQAQAAGDFTGSELARQSAALAQLNFAYNLDYMDDAMENTITSIKNIDNQALMTEYGVDEKSAEEMKTKMIDEYKGTAESYKKNRDFAEYFVGNKLSSEEKALLQKHDVNSLKEALAYELTLGEKADKFSTDILQAIKEKVGKTVAGQEVSDAMTIDDILTKAGKETKREGERKVSEITKLKAKVTALEEEYKNVQNTFYNSVSEEEKKTLLGKLDSITSQKQEAEAKRVELAKEYDVLFNAAKMKNPFSKDGSSIVITATKLDILREQAGNVKSIISEYQKSNPQESAQLQKLVEEYGRSLDAFQKYADLARQITDPNLGLIGKRNFISEIKRDKSPNEVTVEMLESLSGRMAQSTEQVTQATIEGNERVKNAVEEAEAKKKGATIEKPTAEQKDAKKQAEIQKVNDEYDAKIAGIEVEEQPEIVLELEGDNGIGSITFQTPGVSMEGFSIDGKYYNVISHSGRAKTLININGVIVPFYLTSGQGGKGLAPGWYPFFGIGNDGWLNKTDKSDMETYYSRYWGANVAAKIEEVSKELNAKYGVDPLAYEKPDADPTTTEKPITSMMDKTEDYINNKISVTPTVNDQNARKNLRANVEQIGKEIEAKEKTGSNKEALEKERQAKLDAIEKKYEPKSKEETVAKLRAQEKKELAEAIPNIDDYKVNGKVDKEKITNAEDKAKFEEIYDKYDKLITPLLEQPKNVEAQAKKSIRQTVTDMIKNSPYLLEYYGQDAVPQIPTFDEVEEFYELAARAIDDPKIDTDLIAFKNPYNYKRFSPTTRPSLRKAEVTRLQELNNKMADWQLLEGVSNESGISIKDMLLQDIATNQFVEPKINTEITETELINIAEKEPKETDEGEGIRNEEVLQVYQNVVIKRNKFGTTISHLTLPGLLSRMDVADTVAYVETETVDKKIKTIPNTAKDIAITEVAANVKPGANFVVTFKDGSTATIIVDRSGSLVIKKESEVKQILAESGMSYIENSFTKDSGFSPVYSNDTGEMMLTDFKDSSEYSPMELYNMVPGNTVTFTLDLTNEYNQKIIQDYMDAVQEFSDKGGLPEVDGKVSPEILKIEKDLADQLKINVSDIKGRKLGDLKANYDTNNSPEFLLLREEALNIVKSKGAGTVVDIDLQLSKESFIKHLFLGMPNFNIEEGAIKYFEISPKAVVDYGYIQDGKVVLKGNTKNVRQDYVKNSLNKDGLPVVVFSQGKYLIAFPMQLKETASNMGDMAADNLAGAKNLAVGALEFNKTLADNGLSPATYNLYYLSGDNQSLSDMNGKASENLLRAIADLNKVKQTVDVSTWMLPEHSKEDLVNEASLAIDIENNPLSSPKPIINLDRMVDFTRDWYSELQATGELSDEKAAEIANKILNREAITVKENEASDHPLVLEYIEEQTKLNQDQQSDVDDAKNEEC